MIMSLPLRSAAQCNTSTERACNITSCSTWNRLWNCQVLSFTEVFYSEFSYQFLKLKSYRLFSCCTYSLIFGIFNSEKTVSVSDKIAYDQTDKNLITVLSQYHKPNFNGKHKLWHVQERRTHFASNIMLPATPLDQGLRSFFQYQTMANLASQRP